mmetsp:Transcript_14082/g.38344  ORF Transcript_14082/g.38344 Transcript_14082/m.38344 type:complete len:344 (+) Transcript_14082:769-1800(+)
MAVGVAGAGRAKGCCMFGVPGAACTGGVKGAADIDIKFGVKGADAVIAAPPGVKGCEIPPPGRGVKGCTEPPLGVEGTGWPGSTLTMPERLGVKGCTTPRPPEGVPGAGPGDLGIAVGETIGENGSPGARFTGVMLYTSASSCGVRGALRSNLSLTVEPVRSRAAFTFRGGPLGGGPRSESSSFTRNGLRGEPCSSKSSGVPGIGSEMRKSGWGGVFGAPAFAVAPTSFGGLLSKIGSSPFSRSSTGPVSSTGTSSNVSRPCSDFCTVFRMNAAQTSMSLANHFLSRHFAMILFKNLSASTFRVLSSFSALLNMLRKWGCKCLSNFDWRTSSPAACLMIESAA